MQEQEQPPYHRKNDLSLTEVPRWFRCLPCSPKMTSLPSLRITTALWQSKGTWKPPKSDVKIKLVSVTPTILTGLSPAAVAPASVSLNRILIARAKSRSRQFNNQRLTTVLSYQTWRASFSRGPGC